MKILQHLVARELVGSFDRGTMQRASQREISAATVHEIDDRYVHASGLAHGSGTMPYVVQLEAELHGHGLEVETDCSCPVEFQCKHGAALALHLGSRPLAVPGPGEQAEVDGFDLLLQDLADLAPPESPRPSVALQLSLEPHGRPGSVELCLRPLRRGARQNWVKTGLGWSDVQGARLRREHDTRQLDALARLQTALAGRAGYYYPTGQVPPIDSFGPDLMTLLHGAVDAGVELVAGKPLTRVELSDEPARLSVDVQQADGTTVLRVGLRHGTRLHLATTLWPVGDPAHAVVLTDPDDPGHLVLAPLEPHLGHGPLRALGRSDPIAVPVDDARLPERLSHLDRLVSLGSSDGSAALPERVPPRLRVTVSWHTAASADVAWDWTYGEQEFPLGTTAPPSLARDHAAEERVLAGLEPPPTGGRVHYDTVDALHLALLELPLWREAPQVDVVELDAPEFREADEGPEISFDVAPPDPSDAGLPDAPTDWLDLMVTITVEGEPVPLAAVLEALTLEHEHLVLPSGLFVRTDRPEFSQLDDLVRSASQLHERRRDGAVRVGAHDLGLWAQLADLGIVDAQAAEWVAKAQALRDLVELPTPDPTGIASTLRHYQLDGFHWLAFLWQHGLGGILADDMGLGKTLQVLTLIAHTRATTDEPFLVVAPTSVVSNWAAEAARHAPGLRVAAVTASGLRREQTIAELAADADVVVTSYTLLRLEEDAYTAVAWGGLVLDEAQQVKNHQSKAYAAVRKIEAPFRLAVTGTPFENRLMELWALLSIVTPGLYPRPKGFLDHVVRPVEKEGDTAALRRFTRRIKPFMLRRTKELVAADLPPKQEQVLEVELVPQHRRLYDTHLAKERQRILGLLEDFDGNRVAVLAALTKLRQLALDPALLDPDHDRIASAKLETLAEHLREITAEGHRALVFSSFTGFLRRVRDRLATEGLETAYLDGSTTHRGDVIDSFRSGTAQVFLISLKAGGVGLTLTEADYVFVLDPWWNPASEAQAVDRAHRIGQQRTVMVYRMVSADTIEEKVMALKDRKARLFAQVVDGDAGLSDGITADDIRGLFD